VRRECLDHVCLFNEAHARRVIKEYVEFYNHHRPHQGINQQIPDPLPSPQSSQGNQRVIAIPILNGLHHDYQWAA
jgi:transposase InsO family protein